MKNSPLERVSLKNTLLLRHRLGIVQLLLCQGFRLWGIYGSCFRNTERWAMVMFDHQGIVVVPMIWGGHWSKYWYFLSQNLLFPSDLWTTTRLHSSLNPLPSTTQQQEENLNWIHGSYVQPDLPRPPPFSSARWTRHRPPPRTPPPPRSLEHQSCTCLGCLTWRREKSQIWIRFWPIPTWSPPSPRLVPCIWASGFSQPLWLLVAWSELQNVTGMADMSVHKYWKVGVVANNLYFVQVLNLSQFTRFSWGNISSLLVVWI